jgi:hypothetical protein
VSHSRRVLRRFVRGSREISLLSSLYRASTDALINPIQACTARVAILCIMYACLFLCLSAAVRLSVVLLALQAMCDTKSFRATRA